MTPEQEVWRPVLGYEGMYEVSDQGRIKSLARPTYTGMGRPILERILVAVPQTKRRYPSVSLYKDGQQKIRSIHQLVLEAFVGPRPRGMWGCHANDIADDNRLANLRWDTPPANVRDKLLNGNNPNANKTECKWGHDFTVENTRTDDAGRRQCLRCDRDRASANRARVKEDPVRLANKRDYQREWMREHRKRKREATA